MSLSTDFLDSFNATTVLVPVADAFAGGVSTDFVSLRHYRKAAFIISYGAIEDANISNVVTVNASDDAAGSSTTAMAFRYRTGSVALTDNTWGNVTTAAATGVNLSTSNAVANAQFVIEVRADEVEAAQAGAEFVNVSFAETADKTITASVVCVLSEPRYPQGTPVQAIA